MGVFERDEHSTVGLGVTWRKHLGWQPPGSGAE